MATREADAMTGRQTMKTRRRKTTKLKRRKKETAASGRSSSAFALQKQFDQQA
jgi:hypothetical protein